MRTWIKICGHRGPASALAAAEAGADAVGLIFAPSKRRVAPEQARAIVSELPPGVERVGIFVDDSPEIVAETALQVGLTAIQLHGSEDPETLAAVVRRLGAAEPGRKMEIYKAFRVKDRHCLAQIGLFLADDGQTALPGQKDARYLLDAYVSGQAGGSGLAFDWELAVIAAGENPDRRMILAGGLHPGNVRTALDRVRPWGVDVSSGVETGGEKDPELIRNFIRTVRDHDAGIEEAYQVV